MYKWDRHSPNEGGAVGQQRASTVKRPKPQRRPRRPPRIVCEARPQSGVPRLLRPALTDSPRVLLFRPLHPRTVSAISHEELTATSARRRSPESQYLKGGHAGHRRRFPLGDRRPVIDGATMRFSCSARRLVEIELEKVASEPTSPPTVDGRPLTLHPGLDSMGCGPTALLPRPTQQRRDRCLGQIAPGRTRPRAGRP